MRKSFILLFSLFLWFQFDLRGQDQVGCSQLLVDAREAYAAGMVELEPELLLSCLESGLSGNARIEAYKLVITSYLFDYLPDEADALMISFLDENPDYQAQAGDASEFTLLLENHQERRAEQAAARAAEAERERLQAEQERRLQQEQEEQAERLSREQQKSSQRNTVKDSPRLGFILGASGSLGHVSEPFSLGHPLEDMGKFGMAPGLLLGAKADIPLAPSLEMGLSVLYNRINLKYSATPLPSISYTYRECQNRFQLPVSLAVYLNPHASTRVYMRFGLVADYLLSASAFGTRSTDSNLETEVEKAPVTGSRNRMDIYGMGGLGLNIPLKKSFFFVEAVYSYGFLLVNNPEYRYSNQDLIWMLNHVDSDFRLGQISLNLGMTWNIK